MPGQLKRVRFLVSFAAAISVAAGAAERFGDVSVSPQSSPGNTYHGYREFRVLLENHSAREAHQVTLTLPDHSYPWGNSISRITRTVSLGPSSRMMVPLWQPPLPQSGNGLLRVTVDRDKPETLNYPRSTHVSQSGHRGNQSPATVLVSRSLSYDDLNHALKAEIAAMSAAMAVGAPDSGRSRGMVATAWSPDPSARGPHWIELEYDPPIQADRLRIQETIGSAGRGEILITGVSGTNLVRISMSASSGRPSGGAQEYLFSRTPEPVKTVRLDYNFTYPGSIAIDAVELEDSSTSRSAWAASARASSENRFLSGRPHGAPGLEARELTRSEAPVSEWSEYWLSYTPYDAIALSGADWRAMPPTIATAVRQYVESGGILLLIGGGELPSTWRPVTWQTLEGSHAFNAGLGYCFTTDSGDVSGLPADTTKEVMRVLTDVTRRRQTMPDENSANAVFPVVANVQIPVRGMVLLMLAFVLIIGPLNLFILSRMQRRIWLLWTIPAVALLTTAGMFAYSFLREGFTPDVRIEGVTYLDQIHRRASSVGLAAFYCPLTPSEGLFFSSETEATPLVEAWEYRSSSQREVDWTRGQHLRRGWVSARVPAHFALRKAETRRERLQLERSGNRLSVVNGLGAAIKWLRLRDDEGRIHLASNVPAGQKAVLTLLNANPAAAPLEAQSPPLPINSTNQMDLSNARAFAQRSGFGPLATNVVAEASAYLPPGTYVAELDGNPFLENALVSKARSSRTKVKAIVYGMLEPLSNP